MKNISKTARYFSTKLTGFIDLDELYKMSLVRSLNTEPFSSYDGSNFEQKMTILNTGAYLYDLGLGLGLE